MKSTRDRILQTLLRQPGRTIAELAEAVGINPISVRHHLSNLQVEGLVSFEEQRHGVGRPRLVYMLTEAGMEKFPTRYLRLTTRLLAQMKESMPGPVVTKLFSQVAEGLADEYADPAAWMMTGWILKALLAGKVSRWSGRDRRRISDSEISCPITTSAWITWRSARSTKPRSQGCWRFRQGPVRAQRQRALHICRTTPPIPQTN
jgi:predicted ArsR family transcriptional regulator